MKDLPEKELKLTEIEIYEVIGKVAKNHRSKKFGPYSADDIEQEVWLIALEILPKFQLNRGSTKDPKKSLEHWLNTVISNRLKNFYRDKYVVPTKRNKTLFQPKVLSNENDGLIINQIREVPEQWDIIKSHFDEIDIEILDAWFSGERITSYYKTKLQRKINKLLNELWPKKRKND